MSRRTALAAVATGAVGTTWPGEATAQTEDQRLIPPGPEVGLDTVAEGLTAPVGFAVSPGESGDRFVLEQPGRIHRFDESGLADEPFLDIADRVVSLRPNFDERGLLGLAFHPAFDANGRLFVRYSAPPADAVPSGWSHTFVLAEFEADAGQADPGSERRILEIPQPSFNHNAGPITFGPDGYLYVACGDGGGQHDVGTGHAEDWYDVNRGGNGQNTRETLLGGILRLDVDGDEGPYGIPEDNPLTGVEGHREEYFAWGMRNPWGMTFVDEELLAVDVAQDTLNRVNHVEPGGNYGWNVREGTHCFSPDSPGEPPDSCPDETPEDVRGGEPLRRPVIEYPQSYPGEPSRTAIIGGHVHRGPGIPALQGGYVFGDWSGSLFVAEPPAAWPGDPTADPDFADRVPEGVDEPTLQEARWEGLWPVRELRVEDALADGGRLDVRVLTIGRGPDGELYVMTSDSVGPAGESGRIIRLVASGEPDTSDDGDATGSTGDAGGSDGTPADSDDTGGTGDDRIPGYGVLAALVGLGTAATRLAHDRPEDS